MAFYVHSRLSVSRFFINKTAGKSNAFEKAKLGLKVSLATKPNTLLEFITKLSPLFLGST